MIMRRYIDVERFQSISSQCSIYIIEWTSILRFDDILGEFISHQQVIPTAAVVKKVPLSAMEAFIFG